MAYTIILYAKKKRQELNSDIHHVDVSHNLYGTFIMLQLVSHAVKPYVPF